MNTLIIFASVVAVALASPGWAGEGYYGGQNAGHFGGQFNGHYGGQYAGNYGGHYTGPLASSLTVAPVGRQVDPIAIAAGAPLPSGDTVEVAAAKVAHHHAFAAEAARNHGANSHAVHAAPHSYAHATPLSYNSVYAHAAPVAYAHGHVGLDSEARQFDPVAIAAGAPLPGGDTHEVAAAKAAHLHALAAATARNHGAVSHAAIAAPHAYSGYAHTSPLAYAHASPMAYNSGYSHASPIAYGHGSPLPVSDTHEVAAAKALHFHAHAAARAQHQSAAHSVAHSHY